jgi:hypothetical protein
MIHYKTTQTTEYQYKHNDIFYMVRWTKVVGNPGLEITLHTWTYEIPADQWKQIGGTEMVYDEPIPTKRYSDLLLNKIISNDKGTSIKITGR